MVSVSPLALPGRGKSKSCYGLRAALTSQCAVTFPRIQKFLQSCYREIIKTPLLIGNIGEYLVVNTGEYLRKNHKFSLRLTKISFSLNSPRPSELGQIYVEWYTSCKILWLAPPRSVEGGEKLSKQHLGCHCCCQKKLTHLKRCQPTFYLPIFRSS